MSVFGENDSCCSSNFLQAHMFWKFDHMSRTYDQINYRNIWFSKVIIVLLMTAQVFFLMFFLKKTRTLMPLRDYLPLIRKYFVTQMHSLAVYAKEELSVLLILNFVGGYKLELMYFSLIEPLRHGFQLLILLP